MTQITNYEESSSRQARLHRVMAGMVAEFGVEAVCGRIQGLHDHKGTLEVSWYSSVDALMAAELGRLWEFVHELAENVEHSVA